MNIIEKSRENMSKKELYMMTRNSAIQKMRDAEGQELSVKDWVKFEDTDSRTGEVQELISVMADSGEVYATNSATFIREFDEIVDIMEGEPFVIRVVGGQSKNGRHYITVELV